MRAFGGTCVVRSEEVAFMGVVDVLRNLGTIKAAAQKVQAALVQEHPDVVICVDYAGFCFRYVLPFVRSHLPHTKVVYYIPPKVWAWKKHRIAKLRSHTHRVLTIFPFEVDYFRQNNLPQARYVGNPTMESVARYLATAPAVPHQAEPYIALVCGSRISEIRQNLPTMLRVAQKQATYWRVIAAAPGVEASIYHRIMAEVGIDATLVQDDTYGVIRGAKAALVTSGTATLETALLGTPKWFAMLCVGASCPIGSFGTSLPFPTFLLSTS